MPVSITSKISVPPSFGSGTQPHDDPHAADLRELDRVADQVDENLPQADGIGLDGDRNAGLVLGRQPQPFGVGADLHGADHVGDDLLRGVDFKLHPLFARLDLGQVEDVIDEIRGGACRCV